MLAQSKNSAQSTRLVVNHTVREVHSTNERSSLAFQYFKCSEMDRGSLFMSRVGGMFFKRSSTSLTTLHKVNTSFEYLLLNHNIKKQFLNPELYTMHVIDRCSSNNIMMLKNRKPA